MTAIHRVTLIPGDGIGPEITAALRRVLEAADAPIEFEEVVAGEEAMREGGSPLPDAVIDSIEKNRVAIKGPVTTPVGSGFRSINVELRKRFDLYVNLRPLRSIPNTNSRYEDVDLTIVRENTEDLYAGIEFVEGSADARDLIGWIQDRTGSVIRPDSGISIKPISVFGSRRIVEYAFEYALSNRRRKVTAVHKANIMKDSDGLFLRVAREVASGYEGRVEFEERIVDAACMELVLDPTNFDVLVLPNLYGDIVSDLGAGLIGGLGMAPGANIGADCAIFEAVHGSAPLIAGQDVANPTALILTGCEMLKYLGEHDTAQRIQEAVFDTVREGKHLTADMMRARTGSADGAVGTRGFADALVSALR